MDATAFTSGMVKPQHRTNAFVRPGGPAMPAYGAKIHGEILDEIRRSDLPFQIGTPRTVVVQFGLNRNGELVHFKMVKGSGAKIVDDYAAIILRQASRRFPPPPPEHPGEPVVFLLPVAFQ